MGLQQENKVYAESFRYSQEGHPIWPKTLSSEMKPGACGYINGDGDWVTILQLTDAKSIQDRGLPPVEFLTATSDGGFTEWSEKTSNKVFRKALDLEGEAIPPGAPVGAKAGIQYTCGTKQGAVLIAQPPITCARLTSGEDVVIKWVNENIAKLIPKETTKPFISIKKRGFWVIRKTYHAPQCAKTVFQAKDQTASLHVGVSVPNAGHATASSAWWKARDISSGWIKHRAKEEDPEGIWAILALLISGAMFLLTKAALCFQYLLGTRTAQTPARNGQDKRPEPDDLGVVMFVGGIWWKRRNAAALRSREFKEETERKKQEWLGEDDVGLLVEDPRGAGCDPKKAYLELFPGQVGKGKDLGLTEYDDSYQMFVDDNDDDDDDDEDGR